MFKVNGTRQQLRDRELNLRREALERADENEKASNDRLSRTELARIEFARRGQDFAMLLAIVTTVPLLVSGLICLFLAVAGLGNVSVDLAAGSILLAGGLFVGIANLIKIFLPRD